MQQRERAMRDPEFHNYMVVVAGRSDEYRDMSISPDSFVQFILKTRNLIGGFQAVQIYERQDCGWTAIYGLRADRTANVSFLPVRDWNLQPVSRDEEKYLEERWIQFGHQICKLYEQLYAQNRQVAAMVQNCQVKDAAHQDRLARFGAELTRLMRCVDNTVSDLRDVHLQTVFDLKFRKRYDTQKISAATFTSNATVNRKIKALKRVLGENMALRCTPDEWMEWTSDRMLVPPEGV